MKGKSCNIWKKRIIWLIVVLAILLGFFWFYVCSYIDPRLQDEYNRADLSQGIQAVFEEHRQSIPKLMSEHKIPGLSIAVVDRDGILWTAGFGYTDYDRKTPVTTETIFLICSMSKTITATAVMFAVQDKLVELDAPITDYLPDFKVNSRFEDNPQKKITLRHLLSHTSGLCHETTVGNTREASASFEDHIKSISNTWLRYRVGERYSYSGIGYDLAAYILQVRSGKTFAEYMKEKLFEPLDMPNSSVDYAFIGSHPDRAIGHYPHVKQVPLEIPLVAAGGVYANAKELARFIQFHLNWGRVGDRTFLNENIFSAIYTPSLVEEHSGLGIFIWTNDDGNYYMGHSGSGFGFRSHMTWCYEYGIGCLVLTNGEYHNVEPWKLANSLVYKLIAGKLVEKVDLPGNLPWKTERPDDGGHFTYQSPDPDTFTPYKPAWKKYLGTYKYIMSGWKLRTYAKIALALGYPDPQMQVKLYEKNGYLYIDDGDERLDEYLPGLFFIASGEYLDFRGAIPTWKNWRITKIKNGKPPKVKVQAIWPRPADGMSIRPDSKVKLNWRPGDTAKSHKVYFGTDKRELLLLAEVSAPEHVVELPILKKDITYYWRVDEIEADGTIITGEIWQFSLGKLMGWWKLDGDTKDSSGNNHHGTIHGDPRWVTGRIASALEFDGVDDYMQIEDIVNLPGWTVVFWVKSPKAPSSALQSGPVNFVVDSLNINWNHPDPVFRGAASLFVRGKLYTASFGTLEDNTWYHLCTTYDSERLKAYKNGALIKDDPRPSGIPDKQKSQLVFGKHSCVEQYFTGTIDDVRIYNYTLRQDEIAGLFKQDSEE